MTQQISPWLEGAYGWGFGESGWNSGMDQNLLKFSFMFDRNVDSIVASLPPAVSGQAHYNTTDNRLYFAVGSTYYSTVVPKWFVIIVRGTGAAWQFNGTVLTQIDNAAQVNVRLSAVELTIAQLGSAAFEDTSAFTSQAALDIVEAQAQAYTDSLRTDLAILNDPLKGISLSGYKGRTAYDRLADEFHPRDFVGATEQLKLQACIDAAAAAGTGVVLDKTYTIESIRLKAGLKYLTGGQLTCNSAVSLEGVIEIDGAFYSGTPCDNVVIDGVVIDGGGVAPRGVFGFSANGVKVINCHIFNLFATDANGVAFAEGSDNCVVVNNRITMPVISVDASLSFGVYIYGEYNTQRNLDAFNGYATLGAMPRTPNPASHNIVAGNIIENGYYSVALDGVLDCQVSGNHCLSPHWRGIALTDNWDCIITGNTVRDFGTNGIHLSYGTLNTLVTDNTLVRTGANTASNYEGAIQAYVDCHSNKIANNNIQSTNRFGIYLGLDVSNNTVQDNEVVGSTLAGIALDSEWDAAKPGGAIYSRVSVSLASAQPAFGNVIKDNQIRVVSGAASIAASSLNTVDLRDNDISGNTYANVSNHDLYFFAENAGNFHRNTLKNNTLIGAAGDAAKYSFSAGRAMFKEVSGNSVLNGTVGVTAFPALATTPDVSASDFWSALYGSATTITNFLGGADGQEFTLRGNSNVTIANNGNIVTKTGANTVFTGAVPIMKFQKIQGTWLETYRNF